MYKYIFLLLTLFWMNNASANICLDSGQSANPQCRSYVYDKWSLYFKDSLGTEQQFYAKRVKERATGRLAHVDYDFSFACYTNCGTVDDIATSKLWDWRNAYLNNAFYEKGPCDPTEQSCCGTTGCFEIYSEDGEVDNANNVGPLRKGGKIDKAIQRTEAVTNIADNVIRISNNGRQLQDNVSSVSAQPVMFFVAYKISGRAELFTCSNSNGECKEIAGHVTESTYMADVSAEHNNGSSFNRSLRDFLENRYEGDRGLICSTSTLCNDNGCSVHMTCRRQ